MHPLVIKYLSDSLYTLAYTQTKLIAYLVENVFTTKVTKLRKWEQYRRNMKLLAGVAKWLSELIEGET